MKDSFDNKNFFETIFFLCEKFSNLDWMIVNGASLPFHDIDSNVNDIDIVVDRKGAYHIARILKDFCIKDIVYSTDGLFKSYYGIFEINGFRIDIISEMEVLIEHSWKKNLYELSRKKEILFDNYVIPVAPLEDVFRWYVLVRREKDVEKINLIKSNFYSTDVMHV